MAKKMPAKTYIEGMKKLLARKLEYNNHTPYNLGYCWNDDHISGDCWCINPKEMIWSWSVGKPVWENHTPGQYIYAEGIKASGLPDYTGGGIMDNYCTKTTFAKMLQTKKAPCFLLMRDTHMGAYIGEWTENGRTYNTSEFTPQARVGQKMRSYVDANGYRWDYKGGTCIGKWGECGYLTAFIDYTEKEISGQPIKLLSVDNLAVAMIRGAIDGVKIGNGEERKAYLKSLGYTEDTISQAQKIVDKIYGKYNRAKLVPEIAMKLIAGEGGDGVTLRIQWVLEKYGDETLFDDAQALINAWFKE